MANKISANTILGIFSEGNGEAIPMPVNWDGWQRIADWVNQREAARVSGEPHYYARSSPPCETGMEHPFDKTHKNCPGCKPTAEPGPRCPKCGSKNVSFSEDEARCASFYCQYVALPSQFFSRPAERALPTVEELAKFKADGARLGCDRCKTALAVLSPEAPTQEKADSAKGSDQK